jgi:hypothetical protein
MLGAWISGAALGAAASGAATSGAMRRVSESDPSGIST